MGLLMSSTRSDLVIQKGKTFSQIIRWETTPFVYSPITAITQAGPAVVTAPAHGVPDGWRVAIVSVEGMTEINAREQPPVTGPPNPPRTADFVRATVLDINTIELNKVNSSEFCPYVSGGYVQYYNPVDMTGYTARMQVRSSAASDVVLLSLTTGNGRIFIDNVAKTIALSISADDTAALTFTRGVYDFEMVSPGGTPVVTQLLRGGMTVVEEVTK